MPPKPYCVKRAPQFRTSPRNEGEVANTNRKSLYIRIIVGRDSCKGKVVASLMGKVVTSPKIVLGAAGDGDVEDCSEQVLSQ